MKAIQLKNVALAGILALGLSTQSFAVNVAESTSVLADLQALAVKAQMMITDGASDKDLDAIAEGQKRSAAIDEAIDAGVAALAAMEQAVAVGDEAAAQAAEDALAKALSDAKDAFSGILPEQVATEEEDSDTDSEETEEGLPNIYDKPWESDGMRAYYESLFNVFNEGSSYGGEKVINVDEDATKT